MKQLLATILIAMLISCSTTQLVGNWKNPDTHVYNASKVLIIGMTANTKARQQFENRIKNEYQTRGIEAVMSLNLFEPAFTTTKKTEAALKEMENKLIDEGFDTILLSKVIGIENKTKYQKNYDSYDNTYRKFGEDYLMYQDIFFNPDYYEDYTVYHAETSLYCICPTKDRTLIWKGYIDIVAPESIGKTVNDYVNLVIAVLEEQQLLKKTKPTEKTL